MLYSAQCRPKAESEAFVWAMHFWNIEKRWNLEKQRLCGDQGPTTDWCWKSLWPVHTGDYSRRFRRQFVAENGDCCWISPVLATVAELGDYSRQCGQAIR